jgi:putative oxidoreductase
MAVAEHRWLHRGLWTAQIVLAAVFAITGFIKVALPFDWVEAVFGWANDQPEPVIRLIGACELAAVFGLLVPGFTRRLPSLIPVTAYALMGLMFCAIGFHAMKHQNVDMILPTLLLVVSAFVAWGRSGFAPIEPVHRHKTAEAPR